ncbi:MAG TPA: ATP-binding protein [Chitinophagales bacterium]|nr:ATP-binding protein [Chitinophagales bacterium]
MNEQPGIIRGMRLKVLVGFGAVLLAVAFAGVINFISLNRLVASVKILSRPDEKLNCTRQLLDHLTNEEAYVRAYTLTQDENFLSAYHQLSDSVHSSVTELKLLTFENDEQSALADSIQRLVSERDWLLNQFIDVRQADVEAQLSQVSSPKKNLKPISSLSENSLTTQSNPSQASLETDSSSQTKEKKGFFHWFKNIGKKKNDKENQNIVATDSSLIKNEGASKAESSAVAKMDALIDSEEVVLKRQMQQWSADQVVMMQHDKMIMDRIHSRINMLEQNESLIASQRARAASKVADTANRIMTVIGVLGILITVIFIYLILLDVTRSNQLRSQLVEERKRAEKLAKAKEEFLANMSHEIRTPLNAIVGFADQLSGQSQNEKQEHYTEAIQRSSGHLLSLVNQILDFSKIESGKLQQTNVQFDFHKLVREVHEDFKIKAAEKNIWFSYRIDENVPEIVIGDPLSVKQIIINLVSNALKFTDHGGVIITCFLEEEKEDIAQVRIEVKDTGIGIALQMQEKIFEEFTQQDPEITRRFGGTGLGLTITKKLVEFLNGRVEVTSNQGAGSVFSVIIPLKKSEALPVEEVKAPPIKNFFSHHNKCALIVDDEEMNVTLCKIILESWGLKTDTAHGGKEALEKIQNNDYDLVLLDLQMPEMSGIDVAHHVRSLADPRKQRVPLIALTANVYSHQQKNFSEAGFSDVLVKPFKERELFERVKKFLLNEEQVNKISSSIQNNHLTENTAGKLFSLEYLKKTSGADQRFIIGMLQTFITNNGNHLQMLDEALAANDWKLLHRVTHKMIPSFRYLQVNVLESKLKMLEKISEEKTSWEEVPGIVREIKLVTEKLLNLLAEEIKNLQQVNGHSTIADEVKTT